MAEARGALPKEILRQFLEQISPTIALLIEHDAVVRTEDATPTLPIFIVTPTPIGFAQAAQHLFEL
eukprot:2216916-Prorocentrum_lima.AAC.1